MEQNINSNPIFTLESFPQCSFPHGSCITLGVFDGVHRGHQTVIDGLIKQSIQHNLPGIIFVIDPHPKFIMHNTSIAPLTSLEQRIMFLSQYVQNKTQGELPIYCIHIPFTRSIAQYSAKEFLEEILIPFCSVQHIVLGEGAHFGKDQGKTLYNSSYSIEYISMIKYHSQPISSTRIRSYVEHGDMESARNCLGRYFSFTGVVVHGCKRGSTLLGFPTANITIPRLLIPSQGVYAVYVLYQNIRYMGVMNIGTNPTFSGTNLSLEVHIIDFSKMIYGEMLTIQYCKKLRDERHFQHVDDLISQIKTDIAHAKEYLL